MMQNPISKIGAREILDSRGNPTVEAQAVLQDGRVFLASVPSGASKGTHEAHELRDENKKRYGGLGVQKACRHIEETIWPGMQRIDPCDLQKIDKYLIGCDGRENKTVLGANTTLAVSILMARVGAALSELPLYKHLAKTYAIESSLKIPTPMMNIINGGKHANNNLNIQEFMIVPEDFESFKEALRAASEIFNELKRILKDRKDSIAVGDEGGFAPQTIKNPEEAMDLVLLACEKTGYRKQVNVALDLAASEFFENNQYTLFPKEPAMDSGKIIQTLKSWCANYPIVSLEDPLAEDDWDGWSKLTRDLSENNVLLVGDDLFVTNPKRLRKGIQEKTANAILIKPNQIGTISETAEVVKLAKANGLATIASHRSGDTEDTALAHIAVGLGTDGIKTGSLSRSERLAKYNELLRIEEELGTGKYHGKLNRTKHAQTLSPNTI